MSLAVSSTHHIQNDVAYRALMGSWVEEERERLVEQNTLSSREIRLTKELNEPLLDPLVHEYEQLETGHVGSETEIQDHIEEDLEILHAHPHLFNQLISNPEVQRAIERGNSKGLPNTYMDQAQARH